MIRRPPRSTLDRSSAASDVYKRQAHDGRPLNRYDGCPQPLLRSAYIATPVSGIRSGAGVGRPWHQDKIIAAVFLGNVVNRLDIHWRIGVAVLTDSPPVKDLERPVFGNILLPAIELKSSNAQ